MQTRVHVRIICDIHVIKNQTGSLAGLGVSDTVGLMVRLVTDGMFRTEHGAHLPVLTGMSALPFHPHPHRLRTHHRSVAVVHQTKCHHYGLHSSHCSIGSCCIVKARCLLSRSVPPRALHGKSLKFNASSKVTVTCTCASEVAGYCIAAGVKR